MNERKTVRKWMWVWDFEKEEQWLNEMAMNGWALCGVGFARYEFERCEPGEYTVRLECRGSDEAYMDFMRQAGAEVVGRVAAWIYFRRKSEYGAFDLFSDIDSRIAPLDRIGKMLLIIGAGNLAIGLGNTLKGFGGKINLLCATLLMYALGRIHGKKEALVKERRLHE